MDPVRLSTSTANHDHDQELLSQTAHIGPDVPSGGFTALLRDHAHGSLSELADAHAVALAKGSSERHERRYPRPTITIFKPSEGTFLDDGPAFTPDRRHIIFTRCCQPEVPTGFSLWEVNIDGHNLKPVTDEAVPSNDGPSDNLPQVAPNGLDVAYHRNVRPCDMGG